MSLKESYLNSLENSYHKLYIKYMNKGWKRAEKVYIAPGDEAVVQCHAFALKMVGDKLTPRIWLQRHPEIPLQWLKEWVDEMNAKSWKVGK